MLSVVGSNLRVRHRLFGERGAMVNLYFLLIGPPSVSRKSTTLKMIRYLLTRASDTYYSKISHDSFTSVALLDQLADASGGSYLVLQDEVSVLLAGIKNDINKQAMSGVLLTMFESGDYKHSRAKKLQSAKKGRVSDNIDINDVSMSMVGAATEGLYTDMRPYDIISGLASRYQFLLPIHQPPTPALQDSVNGIGTDTAEELALAGTLRTINMAFNGDIEVILTNEAWTVLNKHGKKIRSLMVSGAEIMAAAIGRHELIVPVRVAALVALGGLSDKEIDAVGQAKQMKVTEAHVRQALLWTERWRKNIELAVLRIDQSVLAKQAEDLYNKLVKKHGVGAEVNRSTDVSRRYRIAGQDTQTIEATLMLWGDIKMFEKKAPGHGRPTLYWKLLSEEAQAPTVSSLPKFTVVPSPEHEIEEEPLPGEKEPSKKPPPEEEDSLLRVGCNALEGVRELPNGADHEVIELLESRDEPEW